MDDDRNKRNYKRKYDENGNQPNRRNRLGIEIPEENISEEERLRQLEKVYDLQQMNYHISQLPFAPQRPDAPLMGGTLTLPGVDESIRAVNAQQNNGQPDNDQVNEEPAEPAEPENKSKPRPK